MQTLGILDIFSAIVLLAIAFNFDVPLGFVIAAAIYLIIKALMFLFDIASILDIVISILLIVSIFIHLPMLILIIAAAFLGLKGIMSLVS